MKCDVFLAHVAVFVHFRVGHRRAEKTVFERQPLDSDGACQMGIIFVLHDSHPSLLKACLLRCRYADAGGGETGLRMQTGFPKREGYWFTLL